MIFDLREERLKRLNIEIVSILAVNLGIKEYVAGLQSGRLWTFLFLGRGLGQRAPCSVAEWQSELLPLWLYQHWQSSWCSCPRSVGMSDGDRQSSHTLMPGSGLKIYKIIVASDERTGSTVRAATVCGERFEELLLLALLVASAAHHFW